MSNNAFRVTGPLDFFRAPWFRTGPRKIWSHFPPHFLYTILDKSMFCESGNHKSVKCDKIAKEEKQKKSRATIPFNRTGLEHIATDCHSIFRCKYTKNDITHVCMIRNTGRCWQPTSASYPIVIFKPRGTKCRGLLDTGAGVMCASEVLLDQLKIGPNVYNTKELK